MNERPTHKICLQCPPFFENNSCSKFPPLVNMLFCIASKDRLTTQLEFQALRLKLYYKLFYQLNTVKMLSARTIYGPHRGSANSPNCKVSQGH